MKPQFDLDSEYDLWEEKKELEKIQEDYFFGEKRYGKRRIYEMC